jgi:hypothetical protein
MKTALYPDNRCYPAFFGALPIPIAGAYLEIPSTRVQLPAVQWIAWLIGNSEKVVFFGWAVSQFISFSVEASTWAKAA